MTKVVFKPMFPHPIIFIGIGVLCLCTYYVWNLIHNPAARAVKKTYIFVVGTFAVGMTAFLGALLPFIASVRMNRAYNKGKAQTVVGTVENLKTIKFLGSGCDTFTVDGAPFNVGLSLSPGYQKAASYGGIINKEGMKVRIDYFSSREEGASKDGYNYIVAIEVL